jgi:uncharacterized protein (DUF2342 family)
MTNEPKVYLLLEHSLRRSRLTACSSGVLGEINDEILAQLNTLMVVFLQCLNLLMPGMLISHTRGLMCNAAGM